MFSLIKHLLWLLHIAAIAYFMMKYAGYSINWHYFDTQKEACETRLAECQQSLIRTGIDGMKETCNWECADINPRLLIQKTAKPDASPPASPQSDRTE